jgi:Leucine-rich repeat (LRR) protein
LKWDSNEIIEIPNSISTLTHLQTFKSFGYEQEVNVNVNSITSLHNQIQTCIIDNVQLTPKLNDKSNPIYTLTKLQHLELNECEISELNETISKLTSLQTLLLSNNSELNGLPSSMTKLTSFLHLSLNKTKIQSDTLISVVCRLPSLQVLKLDGTSQLETLPSQISQLTSRQFINLSWNQLTEFPDDISLFLHLSELCIDNNKLNQFPSQLPPNLVCLNLNWNLITLVSSTTLSSLTRLETLNLYMNQITMLPTQIGLLTSRFESQQQKAFIYSFRFGE